MTSEERETVMPIQKGFNIRIYPNAVQKEQIVKTFGCCRWLHNQMLDMQMQRRKNNETAKYISTYGMNYLLPELKYEYPWLKEADATALTAENDNVNNAFQKMFSHTGKYPRFKKKSSEQSYMSKCVNSSIKIIDEHHIQIPKLGAVYYRAGRMPHGKVKSVTIRMKPSGKLYASVLCETIEEELLKTHKSIGVDVGLKDFAILSDGTKYNLPRWDKQSEKQLHRWQRKMSRRYLLAKEAMKNDDTLRLTDFKNYQKARAMCAKIQEHIASQKHDYLDKLTTELVKQYDVIAIEDLKTKNLMHNHHLARAIANASWNMFATMLEYKCKWYGKKLVRVNPAYTSQTCSECGCLNSRLGYDRYGWLSVRKWECPNCGAHLDRDVNAAMNILNLA
jgi:putative transposase